MNWRRLLLAARGSVEDSEAYRGRLARAVLRAAIELEASASDTARFAAYADRSDAPILVAQDAGPPFSALFTLWLSMIQAVGLASRSASSRHLM